MRVAGLVLAAGEGRRMGGPKALLRVGGVSFVEETVCRVLTVASPVWVAVGAAFEEVIAVLRANPRTQGVGTIPVRNWRAGMGASLRAGLGSIRGQSEVDAVLVTLVDLPDVTAEVYARVVAAAAGDGRRALARAAYRGVPGHPVLIGRDWWDEATQVAVGDRGARDLLAREEVTLVECSDLSTGRDVDTRADLGDAGGHDPRGDAHGP